MDHAFKTRENRLRRLAKRRGFALRRHARNGSAFLYSLDKLGSGNPVLTEELRPLKFADIESLERWLMTEPPFPSARKAAPYSALGSYYFPNHEP